MSHNVGRHRASGRYNPMSEIGQIVSQVGTPIAKGSAVVAASGGLIAAIAIPASAANSAPEIDNSPQTASAPAAAAVTAPSTTQSSTKAVSSFGKIEVKPVAKPTGPTPAQLRERAERAQARQDAAAAREQEQQDQAQAQEQQAPAAAPAQAQTRTESSAPSRSQQRQAPAAAPAPKQEKASAPAPASSNASGVIGIAKQYIGVPYVYGGSTPSGFDCSGFTQYVFAKAGKSIPRVTTAQQAAATPVSNPQPGDLVFFGSPSYHVGIYLGDGMMIDAPRTGSSVSIRPVFSGVSGYGRV